MRLETVDTRSTRAGERKSQDTGHEQSLLTPARRAALDALEREFSELLKAPAR